MQTNTYKSPLRDIQFLLWEQKKIQDTILPHYPKWTREKIDQLLCDAASFSENVLGSNYKAADEQECWLDEAGKVRLPDGYETLLEKFREQWAYLFKPNAEVDLPHIVHYLLLEMFLGSNPSFMPYIGFNSLAVELLLTYGTKEQQALYNEHLYSYNWASCLCTTEANAGSDLSRLSMTATKQDNGTYLIEGEKRFISAGMHDLTDNIVYFVLARTHDAPSGMAGLSCFIVNRYGVDEQGNPTVDNHVRCEEVVSKMGLKGLANTHLSFGKAGKCYGVLLGEKEHIGLTQLIKKMMTPARISTGIYALGMASSAYLNAAQYASERIQGKRFDLSMSASAPSLSINEHPDVQRMLLKMKSSTEGCRTLIATLGSLETMHEIKTQKAGVELPKGTITKEMALFDIFSPVIKAYCSDQSWKDAETAIQVYGGNGYLRKYPAEQYARDCKVLSIWEGTNHMQAQFLLRDKLGMGLTETKYLQSLDESLQSAIALFSKEGNWKQECQLLKESYVGFRASLMQLGTKVRSGGILAVPAAANIVLEMLAEILVAWQLLDAALCAQQQCSTLSEEQEDYTFYQTKIGAALFYVHSVLPSTIGKPKTMEYLMESLSSKEKKVTSRSFESKKEKQSS